MMLGHALTAFALVAAVAGLAGDAGRATRGRALVLGVVAGAFAAVPDVDMLFAVPGLVEGTGRVFAAVGTGDLSSADVFAITGSFWSASTSVHRSVTHSLVVAVPLALAAGLLGGRSRLSRSVALGVGGVLLAVPVGAALAAGGPVEAAMLAALVAAVAVLAAVVRRRTALPARAVAVVAAVGLGTHPLGDLFTGEPPRLLYPLGVDPLPARLSLSPDPTLHLLSTFGLELAAAWAALGVAFALTRRSPLASLRPVALVGLLYGGLGLVLVPPTLESSYQFVFSVLAVGLASAAVAWDRTAPVPARAAPDGGRPRAGDGRGARASECAARVEAGRRPATPTARLRERLPAPTTAGRALLTGTAAVTLAWLSYLLVHVVGLTP